MSKYKKHEYLSNTKAPVELLGLASLITPAGDKGSAQRNMMFAAHVPQSQIVDGCEFPLTFTGFESEVGEFEFDTTTRNQDIQIMETIPKYVAKSGANPIAENPSWTIVYRGDRDKKISYFELNKHTLRSDGYGYPNTWLNTNQLNKGNFIPKEMKLCTSPAHSGNKYMMGCNLNVAYMSLPWVTEDAFIISESAARKMSTNGYGKVSFKISPNQIPLNLYGTNPEEYNFLPDIGQTVNENCVLCALRNPSADSILTDTTPYALKHIQHLHDTVYYVPKGSEIIDIEVHINRKCKTKTPKEIFAQAQKYKDHINKYYLRIWEAYQNAVHDGKEISPAFNTLITRAISNLIVDNVRIPGYNRKSNVTLVKKKEAIEFIYITVTYKYKNLCAPGFKLAGSSGNKGTVCAIIKDEYMPRDAEGEVVDIAIDPVSVFNRMNPQQWYIQFLNRASTNVVKMMTHIAAPNTIDAYKQAFDYMIGYFNDINYKWAEFIKNKFNTNPLIEGVVMQTIREGRLYLQLSPYLDGLDEAKILMLAEKYNVQKTPVTFTYRKSNGSMKTVTTKKPVFIGQIYMHLLYKMPKLRSCGIAHINQYKTPVRPDQWMRNLTPYPTVPCRLGEDENRYIQMISGPDTAGRLIGTYANSPSAVNMLAEHQLFDKRPCDLVKINMSTREILDSNTIIGVAKHIFSCIGVDIAPKESMIPQLDTSEFELPETSD